MGFNVRSDSTASPIQRYPSHPGPEVTDLQLPLLLRVPEAARLCGVSRSQGYDLVARGIWPSILLGNRAIRVPREKLLAWIEARTRDGNAA